MLLTATIVALDYDGRFFRHGTTPGCKDFVGRYQPWQWAIPWRGYLTKPLAVGEELCLLQPGHFSPTRSMGWNYGAILELLVPDSRFRIPHDPADVFLRVSSGVKHVREIIRD